MEVNWLVNWLRDTSILPSLLCTGIIFALFHISEISILSTIAQILSVKEVFDSPQILIIFIHILSQPWALVESKVFVINGLFSLVTWNAVILAFVLYRKGGKILVFCIGVHNDEIYIMMKYT